MSDETPFSVPLKDAQTVAVRHFTQCRRLLRCYELRLPHRQLIADLLDVFACHVTEESKPMLWCYRDRALANTLTDGDREDLADLFDEAEELILGQGDE